MQDGSIDLIHSALVDLKLGDYAETRAAFWQDVYTAVYATLGSNDLSGFRRAIDKAVNTAYLDAADTAWIDSGNRLPLDDDENEAYQAYIDMNLAATDNLAVTVKQFAKDDDNKDADFHDFATARADGYCRSLDGLYGKIKTMGAGNKMLTFDGEDGQSPFPCRQCEKLKGVRMRASTVIKRGLVPYPGNDRFECGNWRCRHFWRDDDGNMFTL